MSPTAFRSVALVASTALLGGALTIARAETVYRCADGSYAQQPCPQGQVLELGAPPSDAQRREAAEVARREAALADQLAKERAAREAVPGANAIAIGSVHQPAPPSPPKHRKSPKRHKRRAQPAHAGEAPDDTLSAPVRVPSPAAR